MVIHYVRGILIVALLMAIMPLALAQEEEIAAEERIENWKGKTVLIFTPHPDDDTFQCGGIMSILVDEQLFAEYVWRDEKVPRPFFCQITASNGQQVARGYPTDPVLDKDNDDHDTYHPGIWLAFGDISGVDFWRNRTRVRHVGFTRMNTDNMF